MRKILVTRGVCVFFIFDVSVFRSWERGRLSTQNRECWVVIYLESIVLLKILLYLKMKFFVNLSNKNIFLLFLLFGVLPKKSNESKL